MESKNPMKEVYKANAISKWDFAAHYASLSEEQRNQMAAFQSLFEEHLDDGGTPESFMSMFREERPDILDEDRVAMVDIATSIYGMTLKRREEKLQG